MAHHCQTGRQLPEEVAHDNGASVVAHPNAAICHVPGDLDLFSITHRDLQFTNEVVTCRTVGLWQDSERRQPRFVICNLENGHPRTILSTQHSPADPTAGGLAALCMSAADPDGLNAARSLVVLAY